MMAMVNMFIVRSIKKALQVMKNKRKQG